MAELHIRQVRSGIDAPRKIRRTLEALGLRHQRSVVKPDNPAVRGMIFHVKHLVEVEPAPTKSRKKKEVKKKVEQE
jgi:large subunit ribosomal protein L30